MQKVYSDKEILELLENDPDKGIDVLFKTHYEFVTRSVYRIVPDPVVAEDISQDIFYYFLRKRESLKIETSLKAYLSKTAITRSLNHIRSIKMVTENVEEHFELKAGLVSPSEALEVQDLKSAIDKCIEALPERCRAVFVLSRYEELSYKEIGEKLGISTKTVENQISKALKQIRHKLDSWLPKCLLLAFYIFFL